MAEADSRAPSLETGEAPPAGSAALANCLYFRLQVEVAWSYKRKGTNYKWGPVAGFVKCLSDVGRPVNLIRFR